MRTLPDAAESIEKATEVLQEILDEVTLEYFADPSTERTVRAGVRMLAIGQLLYATPRDSLHISMWEQLLAIHPEVRTDSQRILSLVRPDARYIAETVREETSWMEFEALMTEPPSSAGGKPHLVVQ